MHRRANYLDRKNKKKTKTKQKQTNQNKQKTKTLNSRVVMNGNKFHQ